MNSDSAPIIRVEDLFIEFATETGLVKAVDGISFELSAGKTLGIVGESGCGKSATALSLLRLLPEPPARIRARTLALDGIDIVGASPKKLREIRGRRFAMIFQEPMTALNPVLTVGDQIAETVKAHFPELGNAEISRRVEEIVTRVGIADARRRLRDYPHQMSGGMRQRILIAIALCCDPSVLIADEPTTALDVTIQAQILDLIKSLQRERGMAMLLITHDLGVVAETVDEVMVMYAGLIVEKTRAGKLFERPLHPYTRGLMASLPSADTPPRSLLSAIPGQVPDPRSWPKGCRFRDRCSIAQASCAQSMPALEEKLPGHWAACFEVKV